MHKEITKIISQIIWKLMTQQLYVVPNTNWSKLPKTHSLTRLYKRSNADLHHTQYNDATVSPTESLPVRLGEKERGWLWLFVCVCVCVREREREREREVGHVDCG